MINHNITKSDEPIIDDRIGKTEFEGVVYNFSESVKEMRGKFILEDKRLNGKFVVHYTDGSVYDGELKNGARCGFGTFKMSNGSLFTGIWDHGSLINCLLNK